MKEKRRNLMILGLIPLTVIVCLLIKWAVQQIVVVNTSIELCDFFWINYSQHVCEYLDLQYGVEAVGRILVLVYMTIALVLAMFENKKHYSMMLKIDLFYVGAILISHILLGETSLMNLASFIMELQMIFIVYFSDRLSSHMKKNSVKVVMALYIAGSLGNIIEMNVIGWVTDYLWFMPAYGCTKVSNLEDWLTWFGEYAFFLYAVFYTMKWVVSNFKVYITQQRKGKAVR